MESALSEVFETPALFFKTTAKQVIFDGVKFCDPAKLVSLSSKILCLAVLAMNLRNLDYQDDGSAKFSLFYYVSFLLFPVIFLSNTMHYCYIV